MGENETVCKLADFDASKSLESENSNQNNYGTYFYKAPETFSHDYVWSKSADIFSLGMTLYDMASVRRENRVADYIKYICEGNRPSEWEENVDDNFKSIIVQCWDQNPSNRPTIDDIVSKIEKFSNMQK